MTDSAPTEAVALMPCPCCRDTKTIRVDLPRDKWIGMKGGDYIQPDGSRHVCERGVSQHILKASPVCAPSQSPASADGSDTFQDRVKPWMLECFGPVIPFDITERNHRFLEEALELVQSLGCMKSEAHQLVDYVFGRPIGDPSQEVGGTMVTLAALCIANNLDMMDAAETELARIWTKVEQIRAKQAAKPKHSPLPQASADTPVCVPDKWKGWMFEDHDNGVVYVRAPSGKHLALGYMAGGHPICTDILRELIIAHLQTLSASPPQGGKPATQDDDLRRENTRLKDGLRLSRNKWLEAAKAALAGDMGDLRNRVELATVSIAVLEEQELKGDDHE